MNKILEGDSLEVLKTLDPEIVDCVVTSPPYWGLRDYDVAGQLGLEGTPEGYIQNLCDVFDEVKRVLKPTGTCWVNIGDSYSGSGGDHKEDGKNDAGFQGNSFKGTQPRNIKGIKAKSLCCIPERFLIEMLNRGWILRNKIIWHKPNCMPESVQDRFTVDFEPIFFFTKNQRYTFKKQYEPQTGNAHSRGNGYNPKQTDDPKVKANKRFYENTSNKTVLENGRNKRCVWTIRPEANPEAHFATFPKELVKQCIEPGCPEGGLVLDPFMGSGTTAYVAKNMGRNYLGIELNSEYVKMANKKISQEMLL